MRVTVLDMQPIDPPVGGGRIRLHGLYHHLGDEIPVSYFGTFDWPGESARRLRLSPTLTEEDIPLSAEHFEFDARMRQLAGGMTVIDSMFPIGGRLSGEFVRAAEKAVDASDVVVFSHPWLYPLLRTRVDRQTQLIVYDAQNAEASLRWRLLGDAPFNREIAKGVVAAELGLAQEADLLLFCSIEDRRTFSKIFEVRRERMHFAPNGVFTEKNQPADEAAKARIKSGLGISGPIALFLGSNYPPNVEAAAFIAEELCTRLPNIHFVCCGGVGADAGLRKRRIANFHVTGQVTEAEKLRWLQAADIAINPMITGSGTNIKMFDFMAAGLPILSTPTGARGISSVSTRGLVVAKQADFPVALADLAGNLELRNKAALANRAWALSEYSWEKISPALGDEFQRALEWKRRGASVRANVSVEVAAGTDDRDAVVRANAEIGNERPIAILSTFGIKCGIAEYTSYLVRQWHREGRPVTVLSSHDACIDLSTLLASENTRGVEVVEAWSYDNVRWQSSCIDHDIVKRKIEERGCGHLNVQYHTGFYKEWQLVELVGMVKDLGCPTSVTLHNSAVISVGALDRLAVLGTSIFVHNRKEAQRIAAEFDVAVHYLPMGVLERISHKGGGRTNEHDLHDPLIATFGFLRAHKGLRELIRALPLVRQVFPGLRLRAHTALYPSRDSELYAAEIHILIEDMGLEEAVVLDTAYYPIETVIDHLAEADLIVLPYGASDEGGSGSLATALAARKPLIVSRVSIFEELAGSAYIAESVDPNVLALAILNVLSNSKLRETLAWSAADAADRAGWKSVAQQMRVHMNMRS